MNLVYKVNDKPKFGQLIVFALQQLLAILAATIAVPSIVGNGMSQSAALFGAGVGTIVYLLFTKFKSPVFLGSSFAFLERAKGIGISLPCVRSVRIPYGEKSCELVISRDSISVYG